MEERRKKVPEERRKKVSEEGSRRIAPEGSKRVSEEGVRKVAPERRRRASEESARKAAPEGRRKVSEEGVRKVAPEGRRKVSEEGVRKVAPEGRRKVSEEGVRKVAPEGRRRAPEEGVRKAAPERRRRVPEEERRRVAGEEGKKVSEEERKQVQRKGRRRKKKKKSSSDILFNVILIAAIAIFCFSGYQLFDIFMGYHKGEQEYETIAEQVVSIENKGTDERFVVDFDALYEMNRDVVGWIRFEEPAVINYPMVQGDDNDEYLYTTFQGYDNTVGSIFVNALNSSDFSDPCTIVYGHRMNNGTMFNKLGEYEEKEFWEKYPYFYIYTPDNTEMKYKIYSVGIVNERSELYSRYMETGADFKEYIKLSKECSFYETGVEVTSNDKIVMLSTCTNVNDEERLIVLGVRINEFPLKQ